jgi:hypothetical protein
MEKIDKIFMGIFIILALTMGYLANDAYRYYSNKRTVDGLWMPLNISKVDAIKTAQKWDKTGNWICINIVGMKVNDIIETCEHEAGHEIFARYCEKNATKCLEAVK